MPCPFRTPAYPGGTVTTPHSESLGTRPAAVPPQGCPAHDLGQAGVRRVYGREAEGSPYELYERLRRENGPVARVLLPGDVPAWLVLGHRENLEVMRTPSLFTADSRNWNAFRDGRIAADSPLLPVTAWQPLLVFVDGEEHARLRGAITDALGRFNRHGIRRHVVRYTNQLIDSFVARGEADLVTEFADRLPILVMARLCGIPEEHGIPLGDAVRDMVSGSATALQSNEYVMSVMRETVANRRSSPDQDLIGWLLAHEAELSDDEVAEHLRHALTVSHVTTSNLVANTLRMVLTAPRFRGNLSGGQMTLPDALDQVLWDQPPLAVVPTRWALGDTVLGGQEIRAGDMVMLGIAAGNVDPEIRPDLKTSMYGNRSHLSFGSGPHECPGIDIGRAIADTGIDALLARLPEVTLAVSDAELTTTTTWMSSRLDALPVTFPKDRPKDEAPVLPPLDISTPPAAQPLPAAAAPDTDPTPHPAPAPRRPWWRRLLGR
nr:cytochrome P450 [Streptomyces sp. SID5473]